MKKVILSTLIICFLSSSTPINTYSDWGPWQTSSCYKGLDFRVRRLPEKTEDGKYEWHVQFNNRYYDKINFNWSLSEPGENKKTQERSTVPANSKSEVGWDYLYTTMGCMVKIDGVRLGNDDWSAPYYKCDR